MQHSLLVMLELVREKVFTLDLVVQKMCHAPADLFGVVRRGYLRPGYYADIVVVDREMPFTVRAENILTKCGWSGVVNNSVRGRRLRFDNNTNKR